MLIFCQYISCGCSSVSCLTDYSDEFVERDATRNEIPQTLIIVGQYQMRL